MRRHVFSLLICLLEREGKQEMISQSADGIAVKAREGELAIRAIAEIIREKSQAGQLISQNEIFHRLLERGLIKGKKEGAQNVLETLLEKALEENGDVIKLHTEGEEPYFFSSKFMSESYSKILIQKRKNPLLLIAEVVRENSAIYPRPVPLDMFKHSPFDLTLEEIQAYLAQMAMRDEYRDIKQTTSSLGTVFLYSTLHLDPGYASMLAEWVDVGQVNNP
jgi:hypothetical protein